MTHKLNSLFRFSNFLFSKTAQKSLRCSSDYSGFNANQVRVVPATVEETDVDAFGTLSPLPMTVAIPTLADNGTLKDGDVEENRKISFVPGNLKSAQEYSEQISVLVKKQKLKEALKILEADMKQNDVKPMKSIYNILIGACGRAGYTKKAFSLYNDMKKRGFIPNECTYTALFNSCANSPWKEDGLSRARKLKEQLTFKSYVSNRQQYHAMIKAFGHCGDLETSLQILEEMSTNQLPPTAETFNFLLQACSSLPDDGFNHGISVWRQMRSRGVTPDKFSYNLMLRITRDCGVGSDHQQPLEKVLKLTEGKPNEECGLIPLFDERSVVLPNLLSSLIQSRNVESLQDMHLPGNKLALLGNTDGFIDSMQKDGNEPDVKTFTLLLQTMGNDLQKEQDLIAKMKSCRTSPDIGFFNLLIKKRQFRRDYIQAKKVLNYIQEHKLHPNIMTFGVLAMGCNTLKDAGALISSMESSGFRLNIEIFGSLLSNAVFRRDCWYITDLMNRAVDGQLALDDKCIRSLEKFKKETMERMTRHENGEKVKGPYGQEIFKKEFRIFCLQYKKWLAQLKVDLSPHPWQQYRYEKGQKGQKNTIKRPEVE